jgi:hydrogenase nickel insertion protein HypA
MHEYSIIQALLERVEEEVARRGASSVRRLEISIGELAGVETDLLALAFETFREHTVCDGAKLEIQSIPARWSCPECGMPFVRGEILRCIDCDRPARLSEGDEIVLQRIEMEVA